MSLKLKIKDPILGELKVIEKHGGCKADGLARCEIVNLPVCYFTSEEVNFATCILKSKDMQSLLFRSKETLHKLT